MILHRSLPDTDDAPNSLVALEHITLRVAFAVIGGISLALWIVAWRAAEWVFG